MYSIITETNVWFICLIYSIGICPTCAHPDNTAMRITVLKNDLPYFLFRGKFYWFQIKLLFSVRLYGNDWDKNRCDQKIPRQKCQIHDQQGKARQKCQSRHLNNSIRPKDRNTKITVAIWNANTQCTNHYIFNFVNDEHILQILVCLFQPVVERLNEIGFGTGEKKQWAFFCWTPIHIIFMIIFWTTSDLRFTKVHLVTMYCGVLYSVNHMLSLNDATTTALLIDVSVNAGYSIKKFPFFY